MNIEAEEFELFRELSIGHLLKRQDDIAIILKSLTDLEYFDLMIESSKINLEIINFYKDYNTKLHNLMIDNE
jgi:hypothetical protein